MAKRGEKLPWRVRYEWDNGVKGSTNFHSEDTARILFDQVLAQAERTNRSVTVRLEHRGEPEQIIVSVAPDGGSDE